MNFLERLYRKKNFLCDFLIDEIEVDLYFFDNFLDVQVKDYLGRLTQSKCLLSNGVLGIKALNLLLNYN